MWITGAPHDPHELINLRLTPVVAVGSAPMRIATLTIVALVACGGSDVSRELGARCDVTSECDDRCLAPGADFPGGLCTLDCSSNDDCPGDAACVDDEGGVCLFSCAVDGDCAFLGAGWACQERALREDGERSTRVCRGS